MFFRNILGLFASTAESSFKFYLHRIGTMSTINCAFVLLKNDIFLCGAVSRVHSQFPGFPSALSKCSCNAGYTHRPKDESKEKSVLQNQTAKITKIKKKSPESRARDPATSKGSLRSHRLQLLPCSGADPGLVVGFHEVWSPDEERDGGCVPPAPRFQQQVGRGQLVLGV